MSASCLRRWHRGVLLIAVWSLMAAVDANLVTKAPPHRSSGYAGELDVHGEQRTFRFHVPPAFRATDSLPLVIVLHGGGGSARNMEAFTVGRFTELAETEPFIVVYPEAMKFFIAKRNWNDGRNVLSYPAHRRQVDDVGFLSALIDYFVERFHADPQRVYVTGVSNGGIMSNRVGCELSDKVAAIAPVIGYLAEPLQASCSPARPVSVLLIASTDDPMVPWAGGAVHLGRRTVGRVLSAEETVARWVEHDRCKRQPQVVTLEDRDPQDGSRVTRITYGSCREGTEVALYKIEGGGHTWPGGYQYVTPALVGTTNQDIDAAQEIWAFFRRHARGSPLTPGACLDASALRQRSGFAQ